MKQIFLIATIAMVFSCGKKENHSFEVSGEIRNSSARMVYLEENVAGQRPVIVDSASLENNRFSLTGTGRQQSIFSLRTDQSPYPFALVINDVKKITVNADVSDRNNPYAVSGSPASQGIIDYDRNSAQRANRIHQLALRVDSLMKARVADSLVSQPFFQYDQEIGSLKEYTQQAIEQANSPVLALYILGSYQRMSQSLGGGGFKETEVMAIVRNLGNRFKDHEALKELEKSLKPRTAPEINLPDTTGRPVALSSFRGKYVLVDFWASWCAPCRLENPNVVKAYQQFSSRNFTILGVSLDRTKEAWLDAIRKDKLTWTHISDLQYWNSAAAATYNVQSIPYNVLVDPQGNIIAENLKGEDLIRTLEQTLK